MFRDWGFLVGEIWLLLILAALVGLIAGWLIWGRREAPESDAVARLQADLDRCRAMNGDKDHRIRSLEAEIDALRVAKAASVTQAVEAPVPAVPVDGEGTKPATLAAARNGAPDDLKKIKGIGPKLEKLCNSLGFYHFDQIAAWTADEVAWVDLNLEGFKGRVSRDGWVAQARLLADGGETAFSKKVDKGDVY